MKQAIAQTLNWCLITLGLLIVNQPVHAAPPPTFPSGLVGSYEGQLQTSPTAPWGRIEFTVATTGKATGKITLLNKKAYPFSTALTAVEGGASAGAEVVVVKPKTGLPSPFTLALSVTSDGSFTATGSTLAPVDTVSYSAIIGTTFKVATFAKTEPCAWAGTYTLAFASPSLPVGVTDTRDAPSGSAYASAVVSAAGIMTIKGKLADGVALTAAVKPAADARYNILLTPYALGGYFISNFRLTKVGDALSYSADDTATAAWSKLANAKDKTYPLGFGPLVLATQLNAWTVPAKGQTLAQVLGTENFQFDFNISGAGLNFLNGYLGTIPAKLTIDAKNALVPVFGDVYAPVNAKEWAKIWTGKVDPKTGVYTGTLTISDLVDPDGADVNKAALKFVKRKVTLQGILFNVADPAVPLAFGHFLVPPLDPKTGTTKAGSADLGALLEALGFGLPDPTAVRAGTAGTYETTLAADAFQLDYSIFNAYNGLGYHISDPGPMKGLPPTTAGSKINFSVAPDLSSLTFNGRKVPLVSDQRTYLDVALVFSDATAKNVKNTLTVTLWLNPLTGKVTGITATYIQLLSAKISIPAGSAGGYSYKAQTVSGAVPALAIFVENSEPVKIQ